MFSVDLLLRSLFAYLHSIGYAAFPSRGVLSVPTAAAHLLIQPLAGMGTAPVAAQRLDCYFRAAHRAGAGARQRDLPAGVNTGAYAANGFTVDIAGEAAHTGPWPMALRKIALVDGAIPAVAINDRIAL